MGNTMHEKLNSCAETSEFRVIDELGKGHLLPC